MKDSTVAGDGEEKPVEVSSRKGRRARDAKHGDPRFNFSGAFNPLKHAEAYAFLYEREEREIESLRQQGRDARSMESRREAREKHVRRLALEKRRMEMEKELVKRGKKPYFVSGRKRKIMEAVEDLKTRGAEEVKKGLMRKQKERENKTKRLLR